MNTISHPPAHDQTTAFAELVRGGTLTPTQREQTALVLDMIGAALRVVAQGVEQHPDDPARAAAWVAGAWEPVGVELAALLAIPGAPGPHSFEAVL